MNLSKKYFVFLVAGNAVQCLLLLWFFFQRSPNPYEGVTKLGELETGIYACKIAIYTEDNWEYAQGAYLEILIDGRTEIPLYFFANVDWQKNDIQEFQVLKHPKKNRIALIRKSEPNVVLMMHNFDTNEHWPRANFTETWENVRAREVSMRKELGSLTSLVPVPSR
ncbi:hypothetical protein [Leptospira gomenensis]|uniref:hypothetical protein n=1 Tax=Leptospira gomenensis TaxID=2484974 RepID=UPI0014385627|nr:hypothetical protein [Leptospira gomenensis]